MKKRLSFLLAAMAATVATPALANDPGKMFMINAVTPGVVSFSGEGTATFNNSSTTSNAFSVGSSTNFGVNASAASTNDYMVDANALLSLAGTSQLQQTIGTSSSAANTMAAAEAASSAATTAAARQTQSAFSDDWTTFSAIYEDGANAVDETISIGNKTYNITNEDAYKAARKDFYSEAVEEAYSQVASASQTSASQGASANGTIQGKFYTENNSTTAIAASAGAVTSMATTAQATATQEFGDTYATYQLDWGTNLTAFEDAVTTYKTANGLTDAEAADMFAVNGDGDIIGVNVDNEVAVGLADKAGLKYHSETGTRLEIGSTGSGNTNTWYGAKEAFSQEAFTALTKTAGSGGSAHSDSTADVTVQGVGSIATLNSSEDSAFGVDVATRIRTALPETNGTANGSAGGNLATSSFANQANTQSASAFMQAFGPDAVNLTQNENGTFDAQIVGRFTSTINGATVGTTDLD